MVNTVAESLHRRILEALGEGVCTIDRENRITVFNRAAAKILQVPFAICAVAMTGVM